jgi:molybdopterin molybdotransferase
MAVVLEQAARLSCGRNEGVSLISALDRVLAEPVVSDRDQPPFNRSTRDGFAVRAEELMRGEWLTVCGQVPAGQQWQQPLMADSAVEIMTGAPVPSDVDAVVMLEHVEHDDGRIRLSPGRRISAGENIVDRGSEAREGDVLLTPGTILKPGAIALAASCGRASLKVCIKPTVAVLATGDELVDVTVEPGPSQIRNSNSYGLAALAAEAGATPRVLPIAKDSKESLAAAIAGARDADLLLLSGGVSMGEYDLVEDVLLSMGAEFHFTGVKMQPGKPLVFGSLPERDGLAALPFFGLPGNPVSTQVTFACFVEPLLRAIRGAMSGAPRFVRASLGHDIEGRPGLTRVLPARLLSSRTEAVVELVVWQGSGDLAANARANCYAVLPEGTEQFHKGEIVTILLK